jgi:hypothetical protein
MAATAVVGYQNTTDIVLDMTALASGTPDVFDIKVTRAFLVTGVTVIATATQVGGTVTVGKSAAAITSALACDTLNGVVNAATLDIVNTTFAVGDTLRITVTTNGTKGTVIVRTAPLLLGDATVITGT